jgi:hypothetical protein
MFLKQSTSTTVLVGPVLDASGVAVTTAVIGDFTLTKNGTAATMSGNTISHSHNGHYLITLTTGNTDTIGRLAISVNNSAQAMPVFRWDICQPTVYDALFSNAVNTSGGLPAATGSITTLAGAISTFAGGAVASVTAGVTVSTNNDKTGYSLTATTGLGNQTANITGNLSGSVGSISGVTFPTHFQDMEIAANGHVTCAVASIANNSITASSIQGGAITAAKFGSGAIDAAALATDAAAEIAAAVRTELTTELGRVDVAVSTRLATAGYTAPDNAGISTISDRVSYCLTALVGACSDAQTAAETYTLSIGGSTFTVDYSGLDASGNRSTTTLTKV